MNIRQRLKRRIHFDIGREVREVARDVVGQPPKTKIREDKRRKKEKHRGAEAELDS